MSIPFEIVFRLGGVRDFDGVLNASLARQALTLDQILPFINNALAECAAAPLHPHLPMSIGGAGWLTTDPTISLPHVVLVREGCTSYLRRLQLRPRTSTTRMMCSTHGSVWSTPGGTEVQIADAPHFRIVTILLIAHVQRWTNTTVYRLINFKVQCPFFSSIP
eukprot:TRINITY_DN320_c0_g1_i1.p1 TRINITY_DN320_c0_g1~~TRINITY_DN320_c0_g1_i1.p1  ORF type:complete len:163 (+),score=21.60 TRINITY_DN320_c0_g1_i1:425-913(+)